MSRFIFRRYPVLTDGELDLTVDKQIPGDQPRAWAPTYVFRITQHDRHDKVGSISLRIGYTNHLVWYGGHIGYGIELPYRGRRYAAKACRMLLPVCLDHGMDVVWITCNPENIASRRTCEILGCTYVDTVDLPTDCDLYREGERQKCRYRWIVY